MARLRDGALKDPYALDQLRHLTDNIGPRISGSPQAQHAVEYVAAEMKALGAEVQLEKTMVPHWVRGVETSRAYRVARPNSGHDTKDCADRIRRQWSHGFRRRASGSLVVNSFENSANCRPRRCEEKSCSLTNASTNSWRCKAMVAPRTAKRRLPWGGARGRQESRSRRGLGSLRGWRGLSTPPHRGDLRQHAGNSANSFRQR